MTGRMPDGLRNLGASAVRYSAQTYAYCAPRHRPLPAREPGAPPPPEPEPERARASAPSPALRGRVLRSGAAAALVARRRSRSPRSSSATSASRTISSSAASTSAGSSAPDVVARAERYELFFCVDWVLAQVALLVALVALRQARDRFAKESAAGPIGTGMLLGMIGLGSSGSSHLPFRLAADWWERRYGQTDSGYLEWLFAELVRRSAAEFLSICFALVVVMALARKLGAPLVARRGPGLRRARRPLHVHLSVPDPRRSRCSDADLLAAARAVRGEAGHRPVPLRVEDVTDFTTAPNAYAVGFGPSKRVVLWNTLLDGSFTDDESEVVLAHELGHHSSNHLFEGHRLVRALRASRRLADRARPAAAAAWATRPRFRSRCS